MTFLMNNDRIKSSKDYSGQSDLGNICQNQDHRRVVRYSALSKKLYVE